MPRGRRSEHCRDQILEIGAALFTRNGYHATGLKEILEACQVPRGSFYNFFESKEHFAVEIIEHYRTIEFERWDEKMAQLEGSHFNKVRTMISQEIERFGSENYAAGCLLANLSGEVGQCSPRFTQAIASSMQMVEQAIADDVTLCQQEGTIRSDMPAGTLALLLLNDWMGALLRCKIDSSVQPLYSHLALLDSFQPCTTHPKEQPNSTTPAGGGSLENT